jgi:hypothetical protein
MQTLGNNTSSVQSTTDSRVSLVQSFLEFISRPETSIPLNSNFVIQFTIPDQVQRTNSTVSYENWEPHSNDWITLANKRQYVIEKHQNQFGDQSNVSFFANGIILPQESLQVERGSVLNNGGLLAGVYGSNRAQQNTIKTTFLETETSFIDFVLRPWVILTSQFGLLARGNAVSIKTDLTVITYTKIPKKDTTNAPGVEVRKVYKFYDCAPVALGDGGYAKHDWGKNSNLPVATVDWVYNYYTVSSPRL